MKFLICCLFLLVSITNTNGQQTTTPVISGKLTGFSKKWKPRLYISRLKRIDEIYEANASLRIASVPIDSNGNFHFSSSILGRTTTIYRLYLLPKNNGISEYIRLSPCNFMLLLLNDTCSAQIRAPHANLTLSYTVKSNLQANTSIARFLNRFFNGKVHNNQLVLPNESDREMRAYIATHDPILSVVSFRQFYLYDKPMNSSESAFWKTQCMRLMEKYPELSYSGEMQRHISGNIPSQTLFSNPVVLLAAVFTVLLMVFLLRKKRSSKQVEVSDQAKIESLTLRERAILQRIGAGRGNQEIADELHIEISTVKTHIRSIYRKLNINSRKEVIRFLHWL